MRSSHWEYLGFLLVGVSSASIVSGAATYWYLQQHSMVNPQYANYLLPLMIAGICIIPLGAFALFQAGRKKHMETSESTEPIPPPPPPPPLP